MKYLFVLLSLLMISCASHQVDSKGSYYFSEAENPSNKYYLNFRVHPKDTEAERKTLFLERAIKQCGSEEIYVISAYSVTTSSTHLTELGPLLTGNPEQSSRFSGSYLCKPTVMQITNLRAVS